MRALPLLALLVAIFLVQLAGNPEIFSQQGVVGYSSFTSENRSFIDMPTTLGVIIVFFFYWFKFNEWAGKGVAPTGYKPRPVRHFTTWLRYLGWNTFYGLLMACSYAVIVFFPELISGFLAPYTTAAGNISGPTSAAIDAFLEILTTESDFAAGTPIDPGQLAPYAVMLTTVVWAGMRPFSEFEKRFRLSLQEHAAIPRQAKLLIENFFEEEANFVPEQNNIPKVIQYLRKDFSAHPLAPDDFTDSGDNNLWFLYARTAYLNYLLQKYNRKPIFSKIAERYIQEFKDLELEIKNLNELVSQRISGIQTLVAQDNKKSGQAEKIAPLTLREAEDFLDSNLEKTNESQRNNFEEQKARLTEKIEIISKNIVQLIVCGVLAVGRSSTQRKYLLEAFGINQGRGTSQLDSGIITLITVSTLSITFICSLIYYYGVQGLVIVNKEIIEKFPRDINEALYWSIIACLMHLFAIVGGFFLQRTLETSRRRMQLGYTRRKLAPRTKFAEGIWAACIGFSINIYLLGGIASLGGNFKILVHTWWWALVPGVTAFFAALYTQEVDQFVPRQDQQKKSQKNFSNHKLRRFFWRQGIATGTVAMIVFLVTNEKFIQGDIMQELSSDEILVVLYFGIYVALTTTILGLALGKILIMWIIAEKYAGDNDRRKEKRQKHFLKFNRWYTDSGIHLIRTIAVSPTGAEIKTLSSPLKLNSKGKIKLFTKNPFPAKVVRKEDKDPSHCYIEFLDNVA